MTYTIGCENYYETVAGFNALEPVKLVDVNSADKAMEEATKLAKSGKYDSVTVTFNHPEGAVCFLDPTGNHEAYSRCWVDWYN